MVVQLLLKAADRGGRLRRAIRFVHDVLSVLLHAPESALESSRSRVVYSVVFI
jgi:hypothetical protein